MIFYSLSGPTYKLEIHDHKLKLIKRTWAALFAAKNETLEWKLDEMEHFKISVPKFIWGKLEWATTDGKKGSFRFSTNSVMMEKIEKYMNKLIVKNMLKKQAKIIPLETKKHKKKNKTEKYAA